MEKMMLNVYNFAADLFWDYAKYFFYILLLILYPYASYRFFFKFGIYPLQDFWFTIQYSFMIFLTVMAFWSHRIAGRPNDPGYLKKDDFPLSKEQKN